MFGLLNKPKKFLSESVTAKYISYGLVFMLIVFAKLFSSNTKEPDSIQTQPWADLKQIGADFSNLGSDMAKSFDVVKEWYENTGGPNLYPAMIERVVDGDTVVINGELNRIRKMDAPEMGQAFGEEAKGFMKALVENKTVVVAKWGNDDFNRPLIDIHLDGVDVSEIMIESGYAWVYYVSGQMERNLNLMMEQARAKNIGIWADKTPMRPSEFRKLSNAQENNK